MSEFDWDALDRAFRAFRAFRASVGLPQADGEDDWWVMWHRHVAGREEPRWHLTPEGAPEFFGAHWPALAERWVDRAQQLLDEGPGYGEYRAQFLDNGQIDWSANPKRTGNWNTFHQWHWSWPLIFAYAYTHEERFVLAFREYLLSYFEQFDTYTVTLWAGRDPDRVPAPYRDWRDRTNFNSLGIGHRSQVMNAAMMVFRKAGAWRPEDHRRATLLVVRLSRRLYGDFASRTAAEMLEAKNFLMTGAAGLAIGSKVLCESAWSAEWLDLSARIFEVLLMDLHHPDGGHRELCTQYHNTSLRDLLLAEQIVHDHPGGFILGREPYHSRFVRMLRFTAALIGPDGHTSALNSAHCANDWMALFAAANRFVRDPELTWHLRQWRRPSSMPHQKAAPALQ